MEDGENPWIGSTGAARLAHNANPLSHSAVALQEVRGRRQDLVIRLRSRRVCTSKPAMTSSERTRSVTVRAIRSATSRLSQSPIMPAQLGRSPTTELFEGGFRIEPNVSEPGPTTPKLAASPEPVPA